MNVKSIFFYKYTKKDPYLIVRNLVLFVKKYLRQNSIFQKLFFDLSKILDIPKDILEKRSNQILFNSYEFEKKKFNNSYSYIKIFYDFFVLTILLFGFLINSFIYKKYKIKKFDLICDNIYSEGDIEQHKTFTNYFNSILLIGYSDLSLKNKKLQFINIKKRILNYTDFSFKGRMLLLSFAFKILLFSLFSRVNLFSIFKHIIYDFIKYKKFYSEYRGKYYFNYRFYDTNALQNYIFKENGGLKTSCFQKNICILSLSCYVYTDIFFSLGVDQGEICRELGGEIKTIEPVGSFHMEGKWFKQKRDLSKIPEIDILIIGINVPWPRGCINKDFHNSFYNKFLPWIKKISNEFPNKKIYYKHHNNFIGDSKESKLLLGSNINRIIDDQSLNGTYGWAYKSKIILSFASTMIVELLGNNKEAYFVDPNGINTQWYYGIKKLKKFKLNSYKDLKKTILSKNKNPKIIKKNRKFYCLDSKNTKKRISDYLKKKE